MLSGLRLQTNEMQRRIPVTLWDRYYQARFGKSGMVAAAHQMCIRDRYYAGGYPSSVGP